MPKIAYTPKRFSDSSLDLIEQANEIIAEYAEQDFDLTLRQLYYQFVSRDTFPDDRTWSWTGTCWTKDPNGTKNATPNYKWLGTIVNDARLAGLIDWDTIVDRTRKLEKLSHWRTPADIVLTCTEQFRVDMWEDQDYRPEVWIEKDALLGVIEKVCKQFDVPYFSCRGYTSQSEMWSAAKRLMRHRDRGQQPYIIHLGDHDPSGIDMSRDILSRVTLFMEHHFLDTATVDRIALNMDQVEQYDPPPNPAKLSDSRASAYIAQYGGDSWELDALEPTVMAELIENTIVSLRDEDLWQEKVDEEQRGRQELQRIADHWDDLMIVADEFEDEDDDE
jgi:hypothetical protein